MNIEERLDERARALHLVGLAHIPLSVRGRLHPRAASPAASRLWRPVMAAAMVLALAAVGVTHLRGTALKPEVEGLARSGAALPTTSLTTAMDNDPEFYAWLGSDANTVHLEK